MARHDVITAKLDRPGRGTLEMADRVGTDLQLYAGKCGDQP